MERSDATSRTPMQRVTAVIKAKLGSFEHTKVAIKRRAPSRMWGKVPQHMRHQLLQCQCGQGQHDACHLGCECAHSEQVMVEACDSIQKSWPAVTQLPGWPAYGARERVNGILTLNECVRNNDQRLLDSEGRAASIVVGAMEMYNVELELRNLGLRASSSTDIYVYSPAPARLSPHRDSAHLLTPVDSVPVEILHDARAKRCEARMRQQQLQSLVISMAVPIVLMQLASCP